MAYSEVIEGDTPRGGVKQVVYYLDDRGMPAEEDRATAAEIYELDGEDTILARTYVKLSRGDSDALDR